MPSALFLFVSFFCHAGDGSQGLTYARQVSYHKVIYLLLCFCCLYFMFILSICMSVCLSVCLVYLCLYVCIRVCVSL